MLGEDIVDVRHQFSAGIARPNAMQVIRARIPLAPFFAILALLAHLPGNSSIDRRNLLIYYHQSLYFLKVRRNGESIGFRKKPRVIAC